VPHSGITFLVAVGWLISECGVRDHCYSGMLHFFISCTIHNWAYLFPVFSGIGVRKDDRKLRVHQTYSIKPRVLKMSKDLRTGV
jgi:hypothetical protein